jgi:hypothetical protein
MMPPVIEMCESRTLLAGVSVTTYHNNNARMGANLAETRLTPANVNSSTFGKKQSLAVTGQVYAQPLYVSGMLFPHLSGTIKRNVVFIATQHDFVYAFDADRGTLLWRITAFAKATERPIPADDTQSDDVVPEIGITGTPVIDRSTNTMYFVAKAKRVSGGGAPYVARLYAVDLFTGRNKLGPVVITASVSGSGDGNNNGVISFDPLIENQRPALTLLNGVVYIAFASHGDIGLYHGWVLGYRTTDLVRVSVWNDTADGSRGGIWMSGGGLSADSKGNLYIAIGNGTFDANTGGRNYGDSIVRIRTTAGTHFTPADYFTPFNQDTLEATDIDFGSTGVLLLPTQSGAHPNELIVGGKEGKLYVLDRNNLGQFNSGFDNVVQTIGPDGRSGGYDTPVYFNGRVFYGASGGSLESFDVSNGMLSSTGQTTAATFDFPGANPAVSANGTSDGIVWAIGPAGDGHAILYAYSTDDLGTALYTSDDAGSRDRAATRVKFSTPVIADGKVIVGTDGKVEIYGLL